MNRVHISMQYLARISLNRFEKLINDHQSQGLDVSAHTIASVIHTAGLSDRSPFEAIQGLFGRPSLPLPPMV